MGIYSSREEHDGKTEQHAGKDEEHVGTDVDNLEMLRKISFRGQTVQNLSSWRPDTEVGELQSGCQYGSLSPYSTGKTFHRVPLSRNGFDDFRAVKQTSAIVEALGKLHLTEDDERVTSGTSSGESSGCDSDLDSDGLSDDFDFTDDKGDLHTKSSPSRVASSRPGKPYDRQSLSPEENSLIDNQDLTDVLNIIDNMSSDSGCQGMFEDETPLSQNIPTILPQDIPTTLPQNIPTTLPQNIPTTLPQNISTTLPQNISTTLPQNMLTTLPQNIPTTLPQNILTTPLQNIPTVVEEAQFASKGPVKRPYTKRATASKSRVKKKHSKSSAVVITPDIEIPGIAVHGKISMNLNQARKTQREAPCQCSSCLTQGQASQSGYIQATQGPAAQSVCIHTTRHPGSQPGCIHTTQQLASQFGCIHANGPQQFPPTLQVPAPQSQQVFNLVPVNTIPQSYPTPGYPLPGNVNIPLPADYFPVNINHTSPLNSRNPTQQTPIVFRLVTAGTLPSFSRVSPSYAQPMVVTNAQHVSQTRRVPAILPKPTL